VVLMAAGDYIGGVHAFPAWLKHAPDLGLTVADVVAPAFVFVIGLSYGTSFSRRARTRGTGAAYGHFAVRYLALLGIGAIISAGSTSVAGQPQDWGVLQALGIAGLLCLPLIRLSPATRLVAGLLMLVAYQVVVSQWALDTVLASTHGGLIGAVSWAALLVMATAVADAWREGAGTYLLWCAGLAALALVSLWVVPVSKHRVSPSYVLLCLAVSALAWFAVDAVTRAVARPAGLLAWWGENALALYLLHLLLLGVVGLPTAAWWYAEASLPLAFSQLAVILAVGSVVAWCLHAHGTRVSL
jgi:predicted acyltransferase